MLSVLFVCTGNICRSPAAEGLLRQRLEEAGLSGRVSVESAGLQGWHIGRRPDLRTVNVGGKTGLDLRDLRARQITAEDFARFDLIVAMDRGHQAGLEALKPQADGAEAGGRGEIHLFLDFAEGAEAGGDVADPYFGCEADFDVMMAQLVRVMPRLVDHLRQRLESEAA